MKAVIISGLSGSGKSAAVNALEDAGYYCIDNLPVPLIRAFLELTEHTGGEIQKLAFVIDARNRQYLAQLPDAIRRLSGEGHAFDLVFLTASDEVLARRFSETRRKHPLAGEATALEAIRKERELLGPLMDMAAYVIDTSEFKASDLRHKMLDRYASTEKQGMALQVTSFGFKYGLPPSADLVLDVRFLPNPFFREELKRKTGQDAEVIEYVMGQGDTVKLLKEFERLLTFLVPRFDREGKSYLTIAIGCTGGRHRSVVVAAELAKFIEKLGYAVTLTHRDMGRE